MADLLLESLPSDARSVLDFACGEGALLAAVAERNRELDLVGTDVDEAALRKAESHLPEARLEEVDVLEAFLQEGLQGLRQRFGLESADGIVLNPPWGIDPGPSRLELRKGGIELAQGQYDSADLFTELTVKLLGDGAAALIVPDSLFFPDHARARRFLLDSCKIDLIARLGEGFFSGVFRGTAIVVLRRGRPDKAHSVRCLRLSPEQRKLVLAEETTLDRVAAESMHLVPQSRFSRSANANFTIDIRQEDLRHVRKVHEQRADWTRTLTGGRGVELSKHGEIVVCPRCERARPRPRKSGTITCECGCRVAPDRAGQKIVKRIGKARAREWKPLIAGEDVTRYECSPGREIQTGVEGINYKLRVDLARPRLLIRKTGIGLKAAIYAGDALTTQTVFHYQATVDSPDFLLDYALGVLSSRILLAVHLKRTGEVEWRSHPYVTQRVLAELPIPQPAPESQQWKQARAIAAQVAGKSGETGDERDLAVERLVAGLYGLTAADLHWVNSVLNEAQGLEGVASLRLPQERALAPLMVD